jgi:hypothetical protein
MVKYIALGVVILLVLGLMALLIRLRNRPETGPRPPDKSTEPMTEDGQASAADMDPGRSNVHGGPSAVRPPQRPRS